MYVVHTTVSYYIMTRLNLSTRCTCTSILWQKKRPLNKIRGLLSITLCILFYGRFSCHKIEVQVVQYELKNSPDIVIAHAPVT